MTVSSTTSGWWRAASGAGHPIAANHQPLPSVRRHRGFDRPRAVGDERRAGHGSICLPQPAGFQTQRGACVMALTAADSWRGVTGGHGGALLSQTDTCSADVGACDRTARTSHDETRFAADGQRRVDALVPARPSPSPLDRMPPSDAPDRNAGPSERRRAVARRSLQRARPPQKNTSHGAPTKRGISTASTPSIRSRRSKIRLNRMNV
jgi:hypothetical protein